MDFVEFEAYGEDMRVIFSGEMMVDHEPENDSEVNAMLCEMFDNHIPLELHDLIAGVDIKNA